MIVFEDGSRDSANNGRSFQWVCHFWVQRKSSGYCTSLREYTDGNFQRYWHNSWPDLPGSHRPYNEGVGKFSSTCAPTFPICNLKYYYRHNSFHLKIYLMWLTMMVHGLWFCTMNRFWWSCYTKSLKYCASNIKNDIEFSLFIRFMSFMKFYDGLSLLFFCYFERFVFWGEKDRFVFFALSLICLEI